jgi:predicted transposase YbfD/YdcC
MEEIMFTTIAAVICGAETWNDIEAYGKSKETWLRQYLQLPHGIPSHDAFNRFFSALAPDEFEQAFLSGIKDVSKLVVSAWSKAGQLSLGQVKVDEKSNEIAAIPQGLPCYDRCDGLSARHRSRMEKPD